MKRYKFLTPDDRFLWWRADIDEISDLALGLQKSVEYFHWLLECKRENSRSFLSDVDAVHYWLRDVDFREGVAKRL